MDVEESDDNNMVLDKDYVPLLPMQDQLSNISFETNRSGWFAAILVDGEKYRYN
jgi:hypothetical protein